MRKIAGLLCILALTLGTVAAFAANRVILKSTTVGKPIAPGAVKVLGPDHYSLAKYKAQNHLSTALNNLIRKQQQGAQFHNCSGFISIPCFNSWFITGYRSSVYSYSMVGHSPKAGGTTNLPNEVIPLELQLFDANNNMVFDFDPTVAQDLGLSDAQLATQGPLWDASTTYPGGGGLPPDKGQFTDTTIRASFHGVKAANWHVPLNPPTFSQKKYVGQLFLNNGDWTFVCCDQNGNQFPVVNINSIGSIFEQILSPGQENPPSTEIPVILTDFETAFDPSNGGCCILGFHQAQPGNEGGNAVLVWTWATFIPHGVDNGFLNPFFPFGQDEFVLTHEVSELYHDPFVQVGGTLISPWVDGSVQFAQANLETGDAVEAMSDSASDFPVPLNTTGGMYTFHTQTEALLPWFTRNPTAPQVGPGPGVYSWPNTDTLNNGHPCASQDFVVGEGPAGFFFDDGSSTGQCH